MGAFVLLSAALAAVCAALVAFASWLWANRLQTSAPGPPTLPLLGNVLHFYKQPVLLDRIRQLHTQYGDVFRCYLGPKLVIVVTQPEDIKRVLVSAKQHERDPYFTRLIRILVGNGLLTNNKETWKSHRKLIEPAFHFESLQKYLDTFNEEGHVLCKSLMTTGEAEVDVYPVLCLHAVRSVLATVGGVQFDQIEPDEGMQVKLVAEIIKGLKIVSQMFFRPWKSIDFLLWTTYEGRELKRLIQVCNNIIQRYLDLLGEQICSTENKDRNLWTRLHSEGVLKKTEIENLMHDEILTLAVAGSETTAGSMAYMLALLGLHPEWQEKAQCELDQVFGGGGDFLRPITVEDLSQLTVIDAIIKETLRLFPTIPVVPRFVAEDIPLAGGRYVAPRGCCVVVAFFLLHRQPALFPDPDKFDPGRFMPGGSAISRGSFSYLPFSTGPRRCVGGNFATMEMKIFLANILHRFRIIPGSSSEELESIMVSISSHPVTGYRVSFVPRKK